MISLSFQKATQTGCQSPLELLHRLVVAEISDIIIIMIFLYDLNNIRDERNNFGASSAIIIVFLCDLNNIRDERNNFGASSAIIMIFLCDLNNIRDEWDNFGASSVLHHVFVVSRRLSFGKCPCNRSRRLSGKFLFRRLLTGKAPSKRLSSDKFLVVEEFRGGPEYIVCAMAFLRGALRKHLVVD